MLCVSLNFRIFYVNYELRKDQTLVNFSIFWGVYILMDLCFFPQLWGGTFYLQSRNIHKTLRHSFFIEMEKNKSFNTHASSESGHIHVVAH